MQSRLARTIIGAVIAVALAVAVSYGLISQQTADKVQTQADRTLQTGTAVPPPAPGQPAPVPAPQDTNSQAPTQPGMAPESPPSAPRR